MEQHTRERAITQRGVLWALAAYATSIVACMVLPEPEKTPVQSWRESRGPVVPHDSFPSDCSLCHAGGNWHTIRSDFEFDHEAETGVPLLGAHADAECLRCHNDRGPVALFAARGCSGCHEDVHEGQLGQDCSVCHEETSWEPREAIAQHDRTRFPLVGVHAAVACWRCHEGAEVGNFTTVSPECVACHQDDLARATEPDHVAAGFVDHCDRCHVPTTWGSGGFQHTTFPLTGAHVTADCQSCHVGGVFAGTPRDCYSCHMAEYNGAPDHVAQGFPTSCELCHDTSSWSTTGFSHAGITSGCAECHLDDYQGTTNPDHAAAGFPTTCETCHFSTTTWSGAQFDHDQFFRIRGPHRNLDCSDCHLNPANYADFSCTHCHAHRQSKMDDEHRNISGYVWSSPACLQCHPNGNA